MITTTNQTPFTSYDGRVRITRNHDRFAGVVLRIDGFPVWMRYEDLRAALAGTWTTVHFTDFRGRTLDDQWSNWIAAADGAMDVSAVMDFPRFPDKHIAGMEDEHGVPFKAGDTVSDSFKLDADDLARLREWAA